MGTGCRGPILGASCAAPPSSSAASGWYPGAGAQTVLAEVNACGAAWRDPGASASRKRHRWPPCEPEGGANCCWLLPGFLALPLWGPPASTSRKPQRQTSNRIDRLRRERRTEGVGFEPTDPCGSPVFKTGAINHSTTPPAGLWGRRPQIFPSSHDRLTSAPEPMTGLLPPLGCRWPAGSVRSGGRRICRHAAGGPSGFRAIELARDPAGASGEGGAGALARPAGQVVVLLGIQPAGPTQIDLLHDGAAACARHQIPIRLH